MTPRPRPQVVAPRRTARELAALAPAAALILGLGMVALIVASTSRSSPSALRERSGTAWDLNPVGASQETFRYVPLSPFSPDLVHRPWLVTIALMVLYLGATTAIGSIIVDQVRGDDIWPRSVSAMAGFLPGYLMLLAPLQVLFAAVEVQTASWIALAAVPLSAVALSWWRRSTPAAAVLGGQRAFGTLTLTACGVVAMTALALVHRLQAGRFFLTQDSIQWLLTGATAQLQGRGLGPYLAQWDIQSDEWVFNAPLMFSSHNLGDLWLPFYATQCVSLVSLLALIYGIVHRLAQRRKSLAAGLTTAVAFGSTLTIYPWLYVPIVIGGQPLVQLGHPGRHIGIVAPWIAVLLLKRQRRAVTIALAFATLGLGFVTVHVLLGVIAALTAALIYRAVQGGRPAWIDARGFRMAIGLLPAVALALMSAAFWRMNQPQPAASAVWWLPVGVIVATAGAFAIGAATPRRSTTTSPMRAPAWIGAWIAAVVGGLVLSNNLTERLFHERARSVLGTVLPGYRGPLVERGGTANPGQDVFGGLAFPKISGPACQSLIGCEGLADFLAAFGVLLILVLVTWISFGPLTSDAALNVRRAALLILVAGLGVGLMIVYFTGAPSLAQAIIYTRFLEIPSYGLLALATMTFVESRNRVTMLAGTAVLVLWTAVPLIASEWPQQMARNAGWYLQYIF